MKNTILALALATAGLAAVPAAFAQDAGNGGNAQQGWYVGAKAWHLVAKGLGVSAVPTMPALALVVLRLALVVQIAARVPDQGARTYRSDSSVLQGPHRGFPLRVAHVTNLLRSR